MKVRDMLGSKIIAKTSPVYIGKAIKSVSKKIEYFGGISQSNFEPLLIEKFNRMEGKYGGPISNITTKSIIEVKGVITQLINYISQSNNSSSKISGNQKFIRKIKGIIIQILNSIARCNNNSSKMKIDELFLNDLLPNSEKMYLYIRNNEIYLEVENDIPKDEDEGYFFASDTNSSKMLTFKKIILFKLDSEFSLDELKNKIKYTLEEPSLPFIPAPINLRLIDTILVLSTVLLGLELATLSYNHTGSYERAASAFMLGATIGGAALSFLTKYTILPGIINYKATLFNNNKVYKKWLVSTRRIPLITVKELKNLIGKANINEDSISTQNGKIVLNLMDPITHFSLKELKEDDKVFLVPRYPRQRDKHAFLTKQNYDLYSIKNLSVNSIFKTLQTSRELSFSFRLGFGECLYTDIMALEKLRKLNFINDLPEV